MLFIFSLLFTFFFFFFLLLANFYQDGVEFNFTGKLVWMLFRFLFFPFFFLAYLICSLLSFFTACNYLSFFTCPSHPLPVSPFLPISLFHLPDSLFYLYKHSLISLLFLSLYTSLPLSFPPPISLPAHLPVFSSLPFPSLPPFPAFLPNAIPPPLSTCSF